MYNPTLDRRGFLHACTALLTLLGYSRRAVTAERQPYPRVALVDTRGETLRLADLQTKREYLFFYPFRSTPNFLLDLGRPTAQSVALRQENGEDYTWRGGIGPDRSVVAFSAICSHRLTYPSAMVSFIGYRPQPVAYVGKNGMERRPGMIQCCSERSVYDPAEGARVLSGPAPQALAAVALEEEDGKLYAHGVHGGTLFERFFAEFGFQLDLQFDGKAQEPVADQTVVRATEDFTRQRMACG